MTFTERRAADESGRLPETLRLYASRSFYERLDDVLIAEALGLEPEARRRLEERRLGALTIAQSRREGELR